jgi:hypothetical protein
MKKASFLIVCMLCAFFATAQLNKSLTNTSGGLTTALTLNEKNNVTHLTLRGTIDARDFKTMRDEMLKLVWIDLSQATIEAYSGNAGPNGSGKTSIYPKNVIPSNAFNYNLSTNRSRPESIVIPSKTVEIGDYAFYGLHSLNNIPLSSTLTTIGNHSFEGCTSLLNLPTLQALLTEIGDYAFKNCGFNSDITIPATVTKIGIGAFEKCYNLKNVNIQAPLTTLERNMFMECKTLIQITLPQTLTSIGDSCFVRCFDLAYFVLPQTVVSIGKAAFWECNAIHNFSIPNNLSSIGDAAFRYFNAYFNVTDENQYFSSSQGVLFNKEKTLLIRGYGSASQQRYDIPNTVEKIGDYAFDDYNFIFKFKIPQSVTQIGKNAFSHSMILEIIVENPIPIDLSGNQSFTSGMDRYLHVPMGSGNAYQTADQWRNFIIIEGDILEITDNYIFISDTPSNPYPAKMYVNNTWIATSTEPWIQVSPQVGSSGSITVDVIAERNYGIGRSGKIIIITPVKTDTFFVYQYPLSAPVYSDTIVQLGAKNDLSANISVISLKEWIASSNQQWITISPATFTQGNGTITITAQENTGEKRTAIIMVIEQGSAREIIVEQEGSGVGIDEKNSISAPLIYPNPVDAVLQIRGNSTPQNATIWKADGKIVVIDNTETNNIDVSRLVPGIYFIEISDGKQKKHTRFVKK